MGRGNYRRGYRNKVFRYIMQKSGGAENMLLKDLREQ